MDHASAEKANEIAQSMIDGRSGCWSAPAASRLFGNDT
jgi:hypothetical protein